MKVLNLLMNLMLVSIVLNHINTRLQVKFNESCLKQEQATLTHKKLVDVYTVYKILFSLGKIMCGGRPYMVIYVMPKAVSY